MKIKSSGQFKKDFKKYRNIPAKVEKIYTFINILKMGKEIPKEYLPLISCFLFPQIPCLLYSLNTFKLLPSFCISVFC